MTNQKTVIYFLIWFALLADFVLTVSVLTFFNVALFSSVIIGVSTAAIAGSLIYRKIRIGGYNE